MDEPGERRLRTGARFLLKVGLILAFVSLCAWPYVRWFAYPSLFDDDFQRVGSLRRSTLGESLFRPFNEHMAPLFEIVSWLAWQSSGRQVLSLPLAFQIFSYLAFVLTLGMLGSVARRELRSPTAAMVCITIFALSAVSAETVLWYSASSFEWSALALLGAWFGAIRATEAGCRAARVGWMLAATLASVAAPAFSAIGVLAGPIAAVRFGSAPGSKLRRFGGAFVLLAGTALYLLICQYFAYGKILASSVHDNLDLPTALWATLQAPAAVLIPALFGQESLVYQVSDRLLVAITGACFVVGLVGAMRSRQRPLILGGLALIASGYFITYATRARSGDLKIYEIQRYHLFPQIGLALLIGAMSRPIVSRFDGKPTLRWLLAVGLASLLAIVEYPRMQAASDRNFRFPEQPRALVATLRIETTCDTMGITLDQAMKILDPTQPPWFPRRETFNPLLHLVAIDPKVADLADDQVRSSLIASLSIDDREAIFGGLNATRYRVSAENRLDQSQTIEARFKTSNRMIPIGENQYRAQGRGSWLEFEVGAEAGSADRLVLPDLQARKDLEVWWTGEDGHWSAYRSVRLTPDLNPIDSIWGLALDRLPHWRLGFVRKIRLIFREWGPVSVGIPRFLLGSKRGIFEEP